MELLEGEDLQRRLKREKRITIADLAPIVQQLARGLQAAHDAGVIHRDLKPQNVFLAQEHGELCVKVLDFGVAKVVDLQLPGEEGTKTGVVVGSPHYMSPEQARGLPSFDTRSDLWSFGVIIFKALTGHRPFKGEVAGDVIVKICAEPIPKASRSGPGVPRLMDIFFERALERDPDRRFQSALELAESFQDYADEILDDLMKTERWVMPDGMRSSSDSLTSMLQTPPTALPAMRQSEPSFTTTQERQGVPGSKLPSKPGIVAPPDSSVPPPPMSGIPDDVPLSSDYDRAPQSLDSHTPITGHTPATGPSVTGYAGTVHPSMQEAEPPTMPVPRTRWRSGMLAAMALGALTIGGLAALAWSSPSTAKSELSATAEAAAAQLPTKAEETAKAEPSAAAADTKENTVVNDVREEVPKPPRPVPHNTLPPSPHPIEAPSASAAAAPVPEPPPPAPRPVVPKPRPKSTPGNDWGY